jgi:chromosomal replication initiation ATPase DnaA
METTIKGRAKERVEVTEYDIIFGAIRRELKITKEQIAGKSRLRNIVEARQMFCLFARELTKDKSLDIGKQINRTHASVLYSASTMRNLCKLNKRLSIAKDYIEKDLIDKMGRLKKLEVKVCEHCNQPIL